MTETAVTQDEHRRPRIAIMGEFSAGKSTLTNLLLGDGALPVQVTATQLPPVWIAHGESEPCQVDMDGVETPVDLRETADISVHDVQFIRVFHTAEVLEMCDLIDMPGISDPNMPADMWERVAEDVDGVIWCTHATQAWRQSEDALWSTMPPELYEKSLLLITRFDKIIEERDRKRLVTRVTRETEDLFRGVYPISLTEALEAGDDDALWVASGADAFAKAMIELTQSFGGAHSGAEGASETAPSFRPSEPSEAATVNQDCPAEAPQEIDPVAPRVMPQRVKPLASTATSSRRPAREEAQDPARPPVF